MNRNGLMVNRCSEGTYKTIKNAALDWNKPNINQAQRPSNFGTFKIQDLIYPLYDIQCMDKIMSDTRKLFSATNIVGYILGLLGISLIAVTQALTALIPLLFAPVVCGILGLVLYNLQSVDTPINNVEANPNAVPQK
tara:strand:+ start:144 stop:554 length:411 start_codon:yes stop_codon:yes gene_type:complete